MSLELPHDILSQCAERFAQLPKDAVIGVAVSGDLILWRCSFLCVPPCLRQICAPRLSTTGCGLTAKAEAQWVSALCAKLGVAHSTLTVSDLPKGPNLQARARSARYDALAAWGHDMACSCICLGHSQTDVAENFLIRLARGSGVDGLSVMRGRWTERGMQWLRPLLEVSRAELQAFLRAQGQGWCDDPSNEDPAFMRVRMRQAAPDLDALGLTSLRLAKTATRMGYVQEALEYSMRGLWPQVAQIDVTDVLFDREALSRLPREYVERMVSDALNWISGQPYRPRNSALLRAIAAKKTATLHGCVLIPQPRIYCAFLGSFLLLRVWWPEPARPGMAGYLLQNIKNLMKFGRLAPLVSRNARSGARVVARVWRFWPARHCGKGNSFGRTNGTFWPKRSAQSGFTALGMIVTR
jgi:tRNA(Ile)-lysidine synthase